MTKKPTPLTKLLSPMPSKYDPCFVESDWDNWWVSNGFYKARKSPSDSKFVMILPPPNVTGKLHIGHALMCTVEDALTRWHRMRGEETIWVPGTDHAGIATQNVVERHLMRTEGTSRFDLGREEFIRKMWEWKESYGSGINQQIRKMGSSVDWGKKYFTLDQNLTKAVKKAFVKLYNEKKIYRSKRFVNWSSKLATAIADCEVVKTELTKRTFLDVPGHERKVEFGVIHKFSYKFVDSEEEILIETTRPETMLGDVAVAVHPKDKRYEKFVGKMVQHPFVDRKMPIITDSVLVDMEKGTGVVKITPAHDENDYNCGQRHELPSITVITEDGRMNENSGPYRNMMRFDCRYKVIKDLEKLGQYHGRRDFPMQVNRCSLSNDVIEPTNTSQWWLNCDEMAEKSLGLVRNGELEIIPKREEKTLFSFLENIRPWCISRQLWWGHRIPAYLPEVDGAKLNSQKGENWIVAESRDEAEKIAQKRFGDRLTELHQDEDVLDTWFSSALLPFSVFGWPKESDELNRYFPGSVLETGSDILFFWVARMVFLSLALTEKSPFKKVLLHPIVRTADGSKMSKSKGNVIDPLEVINGVGVEELIKKLKESNLSEKQIKQYTKIKRREFPKGIEACGADALRFSLLNHLNSGNSINLDIKRVKGYRLFCNKMWQASKFTFSHLEKNISTIEKLSKTPEKCILKHKKEFSLPNKWILSRLARATEIINNGFSEFNLVSSAMKSYDFFLKEFCDIYIELCKPILWDNNDPKLTEEYVLVLFTVFHNALRLFHPMMPFISEELFQRFPCRNENAEHSIMVSEYPQFNKELIDADAETQMERAMENVRSIRSARMQHKLGNAKIAESFVRLQSDENSRKEFENFEGIIKTLSKIDSFIILDEKSAEEISENMVGIDPSGKPNGLVFYVRKKGTD